MNKIAYLQNTIQNYAWGSRTFIQDLTGNLTSKEVPQAELWMGSHQKAPSRVLLNNITIPLPEAIKEDPEEILGYSAAENFKNTLPFLFKVLAASDPLSLQAHPDKTQAEKGFAYENKKNIAIDASDRNYRDNNHKPELICALEPMWVLKGFRNPEAILTLFNKAGLRSEEFGLDKPNRHNDEEILKNLFQLLLTLEKEQRINTINTVMEHINKAGQSEPELEWISRLNQYYPGDIGVLAPLFLNLVLLKPGRALHIPSGELHAYLNGSGLEIMANSDNVLRGGLTPKHIDIDELMDILNFSPSFPKIITPEKISVYEAAYPSPADEFILSVISINSEEAYYSQLKRNVEIMICTGGSAGIKSIDTGDELILKRGSSIIVPASVGQYQINGTSTIYKASVPG